MHNGLCLCRAVRVAVQLLEVDDEVATRNAVASALRRMEECGDLRQLDIAVKAVGEEGGGAYVGVEPLAAAIAGPASAAARVGAPGSTQRVLAAHYALYRWIATNIAYALPPVRRLRALLSPCCRASAGRRQQQQQQP
jgi:hypothetical protein